jgi:hypothetical protein
MASGPSPVPVPVPVQSIWTAPKKSRRYDCLNKYPDIRTFIEQSLGHDAKQIHEVETHLLIPCLTNISFVGKVLDFHHALDPLRFIFLCFSKPVTGDVTILINGQNCQCLILPTCPYIAYLDTGMTSIDINANIMAELAGLGTRQGKDIMQKNIYDVCMVPARINMMTYKAPNMPKPFNILGYTWRICQIYKGKKHDAYGT